MTELYINNTLVDLGDDITHSLNYAIADIREPDKRNTSYSKTISIVGTSITNKLFAHLFEVNMTVNSSGTTNFNPSYNPNLKASALMYADNILVFSGYVQLKNIVVLDKFDVEYEVVMYGRLGDLFFDLGENELTEIDFSEYDHQYTKDNIINSWTQVTRGQGYMYPMIDRALNDTITWRTEHWQPGMYLKTYMDKIFAYAGYNYTSTFLNSHFFKGLVMPFSGEGLKLTEDQVRLRKFFGRQNTTINSVTLQGINNWTTVQYDGEDYDDGNDFDTGTYKWTCPASGTYNFTAEVNISLRFNPSSPAYFKSVNATTINNIGGRIQLVRVTPSGTVVQLDDRSILSAKAGSAIGLPGGALISGDTTYSIGTVRLDSPSGGVPVNTGDTVYVRYYAYGYSGTAVSYNNFTDSSNSSVGGDVYVVTNQGSFILNSIVNDGFKENETIPMNSAIPTKIKMRDLLTSTLKMFNLYVEEDKSNPKHLIITPRNDFYSNTVKDWSDKLDLNSPFEIQPMGALDFKTYELTWEYDEDYYNKYYKDKYGKVYGNRTREVYNDFLSDVKEVKTIWAATIPTNNGKSDRILPTILNPDGSSKQIAAKPRLIYYSQTRLCNAWYFLYGGASSTYYLYPHTGHLDDPLNSTIDLNFGVVSELFYTAPQIIYTNNNTYNKYHKQFVEEVTDKDSKIVTAWFRLTPSDILQLDFRVNYLFDYNYYRLNRVYDYNPNGDGLTRCEFIKLNTATTFESSGITFGGGSAQYEQNNDNTPMLKTAVETNKNSPYSNHDYGENNIISDAATDIFVLGDYNSIGSGTSGAFLINSSGNNIAGDLQNVVLVNSSGVTVTESGTAYINGIRIDNAQKWVKVQFDITDVLAAISTSDRFVLHQMQPKEVLHAIVSKSSEQWVSSGNGDVDELYFDIGTYAQQNKYVDGLVDQVNYYSGSHIDSSGGTFIENFILPTDIYITSVVVGAGMSYGGMDISVGKQDVFLLKSKLE